VSVPREKWSFFWSQCTVCMLTVASRYALVRVQSRWDARKCNLRFTSIVANITGSAETTVIVCLRHSWT